MFWRQDLVVPQRPYGYLGAKHKAHGTLIGDVQVLYALERQLRAGAVSSATGGAQIHAMDCNRFAIALRRFLAADYPEPMGRPDVSGRNFEVARAYWALVAGAREKQEIASRAIAERLEFFGLTLAPASVSRIATAFLAGTAGGDSTGPRRVLRQLMAAERRAVRRNVSLIGSTAAQRRRDAYWIVASWALSVVAEDIALAADWEARRPVPQPEPKL